MAYLIGTDEAGYGPNLGPLVISVSAWQVDDAVPGEDLYGRLGGAIVRTRKELGSKADGRCVIADSKKVYSPGSGLKHLERALFAAWTALGRVPVSWREAWQLSAPGAADVVDTVAWYADYDVPLPIDAESADVARVAKRFAAELEAAGVRLVALSSRAVFPEQFNRLVERFASKGAALTQQTLDLAAGVIRQLGDGPITVVCDKHGGRNRYAAALWEHFPEAAPIVACEEGRRQSVYRFGPAERRLEFRFQTGGEAFLPTALASMQSKYLRELAMRAFNAFWCRQLPGLRPTAGYPQDAKRFRQEIAPRFAELRIDESVLWRSR